MPITETVKLLKQKRKQFNLSQSLVSRLLKIPQVSLYRWEKGTNAPSPYYLREIRKLLKTIDEIQNDRLVEKIGETLK